MMVIPPRYLHGMSEVRHTRMQAASSAFFKEVLLDRDEMWLSRCPSVIDGRQPGVMELRWANEMGYEYINGRFRLKEDVDGTD